MIDYIKFKLVPEPLKIISEELYDGKEQTIMVY